MAKVHFYNIPTSANCAASRRMRHAMSVGLARGARGRVTRLCGEVVHDV